MKYSSTKAAALSLLHISSAFAAVSRTCPGSDQGVCYSLNIPDQTAASGTGDIFLKMEAPATGNQYVAFGQGSGMSGSNMFLMYLSADGTNVTVSPRLGVGHVEPKFTEETQIQLLEGTGVSNGVMTANIKCSNCNSWNGGKMDFTASSSSWIYAAKSGTPIQSDDKSADIGFHDDHGVFSWDLSTAKGGSDLNPFVASASTPGRIPPNTAVVQAAATSSGGGRSSSAKILIAHAVLACLSIGFFLPVGGILIRVASLQSLVKYHMAIQYLGLSMFIAAFGTGAWYATKGNYWNHAHPIIGCVVFALMLTQPLWGILHHRGYQALKKRTFPTWLHLGAGRVVIFLGMINGGLGLKLTHQTKAAKIGYGVGVGVMGLIYIIAIIFGEAKRAKNSRNTSLADSGRTGDDMLEKNHD